MSLKSSNTTCDLYRSGSSPPATPAIAGIPIYLEPDWDTAHHVAVGSGTYGRWTHIALLDAGTDIRDAYQPQASFEDQWGGTYDTLYVTDKNGTPFDVVFVARTGRGAAGDVFRVYLQRRAVTWPTNNL